MFVFCSIINFDKMNYWYNIRIQIITWYLTTVNAMGHLFYFDAIDFKNVLSSTRMTERDRWVELSTTRSFLNSMCMAVGKRPDGHNWNVTKCERYNLPCVCYYSMNEWWNGLNETFVSLYSIHGIAMRQTSINIIKSSQKCNCESIFYTDVLIAVIF